MHLVFTDQRTVSFGLALPTTAQMAMQRPWATRVCSAAGVPLPEVSRPADTPAPNALPDEPPPGEPPAVPPLLAGWDARALPAPPRPRTPVARPPLSARQQAMLGATSVREAPPESPRPRRKPWRQPRLLAG